jgi:hypothetical protein
VKQRFHWAGRDRDLRLIGAYDYVPVGIWNGELGRAKEAQGSKVKAQSMGRNGNLRGRKAEREERAHGLKLKVEDLPLSL